MVDNKSEKLKINAEEHLSDNAEELDAQLEPEETLFSIVPFPGYQEYQTFIYSGHREEVYIPDLKQTKVAKINHTARDAITQIKRSIEYAKERQIKFYSIVAVNPQASNILVAAVMSLMKRKDSLLDNLVIDLGLAYSDYGEIVVVVNLEAK